jgi:hypothetical protein
MMEIFLSRFVRVLIVAIVFVSITTSLVHASTTTIKGKARGVIESYSSDGESRWQGYTEATDNNLHTRMSTHIRAYGLYNPDPGAPPNSNLKDEKHTACERCKRTVNVNVAGFYVAQYTVTLHTNKKQINSQENAGYSAHHYAYATSTCWSGGCNNGPQ